MQRTQQRKVIRLLSVGVPLLALALAIVLYVPIYTEYFVRGLGWLVLLLLVATYVSPLGRYVLGNETQKVTWIKTCLRVIGSYFIIFSFLCGLLVLLTTNVVAFPPEQLWQSMQADLAQSRYTPWFYPWLLYIWATLLIGSVGYKKHAPKMSSIVAQLCLPRQLTPFGAAIVDYMAVFGFYVGMLAMLGTAVLTLAQLLCGLLGYQLDFHIDLTTLALAFALSYLPLSSLWSTLSKHLEKLVGNPGATLMGLLMVFSLFVLLIYAVVHIFLNSFADYFAPLEAQLPQVILTTQLQQLNWVHVLWGFSVISMTIVGGWWAHLLQGYTVRQATLILLAPLVLVGVVSQLYWFSGVTLNFSWLHALSRWIWTAPQAYCFSLLPVILLISALWRQNNFIQGMFWVFPNTSGRKLTRIGKMIVWGGLYVGYAAMFNLLTGIFFMQTIIHMFAVFFSFALLLVLLGSIKLIIRWGKLC